MFCCPGSTCAEASYSRIPEARPEDALEDIPKDGGFKGAVPLLQFSSAVFLCRDDEPSVKLEVIRVGNLAGRSIVSYQTENGSALAGTHYGASQGRLDFAPGDRAKEIEIKIGEYNDDFWNPTLAFRVKLIEKNLIGGELDANLDHIIVKKIDSSTFPSEAYTGIAREEVRHVGLLLEICRMMYQMPSVRRGTCFCLAVDFVHNVWYFINLFLYVYFINYLIHLDKELYLIKDREMSLALYASLTVLIVVLLHALDYGKLNAGVSGTCRAFLQGAIVSKYLEYLPTVRHGVSEFSVIQAIKGDATLFVGSGYMGLLQLVKESMQFFFMVLFKLVSPYVFGTEADISMLVPLAVLPAAFMLLLCIREPTFRVALQKMHQEDGEMGDTVNDVVEGCNLVIDYDRLTYAKEIFFRCVAEYNTALGGTSKILLNTEYFTCWITAMVAAGYIFIGGKGVLRGSVSVGMLITNLNILKDAGRITTNIFDAIVNIQRTYPSVLNIYHLLNLETDVAQRLRIGRRSHEIQSAWRSPDDATIREDSMPIRIELYPDYEFSYKTGVPTTILNFDSNLEIQQGQLVAIVGGGGSGKTTCLRLIGGTFLPDTEKVGSKLGVCIPCHLRRTSVSSQAIFYGGTLFENLTFGCASKDPDGQQADRRRALEICKELGVSAKVIEYFDKVANWPEEFSEAECKILNIARALFFNAEIICFHKPLQKLDTLQMPRVMEVLHNHINNKGLALEPDTEKRRRLRTVFTTSSNPVAVMTSDLIYRVTPEKGIEHVSHKMAEKLLQRYKIVNAETIEQYTGKSGKQETAEIRNSRKMTWSDIAKGEAQLFTAALSEELPDRQVSH